MFTFSVDLRRSPVCAYIKRDKTRVNSCPISFVPRLFVLSTALLLPLVTIICYSKPLAQTHANMSYNSGQIRVVLCHLGEILSIPKDWPDRSRLESLARASISPMLQGPAPFPNSTCLILNDEGEEADFKTTIRYSYVTEVYHFDYVWVKAAGKDSVTCLLNSDLCVLSNRAKLVVGNPFKINGPDANVDSGEWVAAWQDDESQHSQIVFQGYTTTGSKTSNTESDGTAKFSRTICSVM